VNGKVWVGGLHKKIQTRATEATDTNSGRAAAAGAISERDAEAWEIGGKVGTGGFELLGYYYDGKNHDAGIGQAINTGTNGINTATAQTDNKGGYVQATYVLPIKTKLGASWGESVIETAGQRDAKREAWIVGAYHPLTKHLNLVAEYNHLDIESTTALNAARSEGKAKTVSLGAILFF
jgi:predicted porin